jgi:hypothetical protein
VKYEKLNPTIHILMRVKTGFTIDSVDIFRDFVSAASKNEVRAWKFKIRKQDSANLLKKVNASAGRKMSAIDAIESDELTMQVFEGSNFIDIGGFDDNQHIKCNFDFSGELSLPQYKNCLANISFGGTEEKASDEKYNIWIGSEKDPSCKVEVSRDYILDSWFSELIIKSMDKAVISLKLLDSETIFGEQFSSIRIVVAFESRVEIHIIGEYMVSLSPYSIAGKIAAIECDSRYLFVLSSDSKLFCYVLGNSDKLWRMIESPMLLFSIHLENSFDKMILTSNILNLMLSEGARNDYYVADRTFEQRGDFSNTAFANSKIQSNQVFSIKLKNIEKIYVEHFLKLPEYSLRQKRDFLIHGHTLLCSALSTINSSCISKSESRIRKKHLRRLIEESFGKLGDIFFEMSHKSQAARLYASSSISPAELLLKLEHDSGALLTYLYHHLQNPCDKSISLLLNDADLVSSILQHFFQSRWYQLSQIFLRT